MAKEEFFCDICTAPMKCVKTIGTKESGKSYRQRRFACTCCDYTKMVFACGVYDERLRPDAAINEVKKNYEKEAIARKPY
jgi:hypothetical protein